MSIASLKPYIVVFTASACILVIEIVAGRILAPVIGVSLYTWTSIIGIVLAGISLGNYLGGRIADWRPDPTTLGLILLAGGVSSLAILPIFALVSDLFDSVPILPRIVLIVTSLFIAPSIILGMVTPVVIKLELKDLEQTGNVVGRIYALSTAGSILGTFLTGFVLIQWWGTRTILVVVALVIVLLALAFGNLWRPAMRRMGVGNIAPLAIALLTIAGSLAMLAVVTGRWEIELVKSRVPNCLEESAYFCIKVRDEGRDGRMIRILTLDALQHSFTDLNDPAHLEYTYEKVFGDIADYIAETEPGMRVLFIGGGGYTMPRYLEHTYPESTLEVIEIDPAVTEVALDMFGLGRDTSVISYNEDARMKIPRLPHGKYDLVVGDAFNDLSVPYHLTTKEFNEDVVDLLNEDGIYVANVVDERQAGRFLRSFASTLKETFDYVYLIRGDSNWDSPSRHTYVIAGSNRPFTAHDLNGAATRAGRASETELMPGTEFALWLKEDPGVILRDDYVPVDNMLAPLYLDSR